MKPSDAPMALSVAQKRAQPLQRLEKRLLWLALLWLLLVFSGPHIAQYADYHAFADQSQHFGLSHWADVLSNVPMILLGVFGVWQGRQGMLLSLWPAFGQQRQLFFYGLLLTGIGSFIYHLAPDDQTLWLDRLGMCVAFSGMLGLTLTHRCSDRAGQVMAYAALIAGPLSLWLWQYNGSLWAWSLYQGGGMLLIVGMAFLPRTSNRNSLNLAAVMGCYLLAKLCELGDHQIYALTQEWVSGHTLKHLWSAAAGVPLLLGFKGINLGSKKTAPGC